MQPFNLSNLNLALQTAARSVSFALKTKLTGREIREAREVCREITGRKLGGILSGGASHKVASTPMGEKVAALAISYLSPAEAIRGPLAALGFDLQTSLCRFSSSGCRAACLGENSGLLILPSAREAREARTLALALAPGSFGLVLGAELAALRDKAARAGGLAFARLDGSTDLGLAGRIMLEASPSTLGPLRFYDYTKDSARALDKALPRAFSAQMGTLQRAALVLASGGTCSAVFSIRKGETLPASFLGAPVLDGDAIGESWAWKPEARGAVIGLRFKQARGRAAALQRALVSGFVFDASETF